MNPFYNCVFFFFEKFRNIRKKIIINYKSSFYLDAGLEWVGVDAKLLCEIGESPLELFDYLFFAKKIEEINN